MEDLVNKVKIHIDSSTEFAMINEYITYSIFIENKSNLDLENFFVSINIPENTEYVDESLIASEAYEISDKESGINFTLKAMSTFNAFYKVEVIKIPKDGSIFNRNFIKYVDNEELISEGSKMIYTRIKGALIKKEEGFRKSIIDGQLKIGEVITFEIIIKNTGNLTAFDLFLTDILPENIKPLTDKVIVNNRILELRTLNNVPLGNLGPFKSLTIRYKSIIESITQDELSFSVGKLKYRYFNDYINDYIDAETVSNELELNVKEAIINGESDFFVELDKDEYFIDDEINCSLKIINSGNTKAKNCLISMELANGLNLIDNKLLLNNLEIKFNNINNIILEDLDCKEEILLKFKLKADSVNPKQKFITAFITYDYIDLEIGGLVSKTSKSNMAYFNVYGVIINNNEKIILKSVSKNFCKIGDEIEHKINIKNSGNLSCDDLTINEVEEFGQEIIINSFKVDNKYIPVNSKNNGVLIGTVKPGEEKNILYKSKVVDIPMDESIKSRAYIEFNEKSKSNIKRKVWCKENEISVIGARIEGDVELSNYYKAEDEFQNYKVNIRNRGNKKADNLKLILLNHKGISINSISYYKNDERKEVTNSNIIFIDELEIFEEMVFEVKFTIDNQYFLDDLFAYGELEYSYYLDEEKSLLENEKNLIKRKYLKIIYPKLELVYESSLNGIEGGEEFSLDLILKNKGNIDFYNIDLKEVIPIGLQLLYANERVEENNIKIAKLEAKKERKVTLVLRGDNNFKENNININIKANYEYYLDKLIKEYKEFDSFQLEFINNYLDFTLVTENKEVLIGESFYNIITIKNVGNYSLKNAKLYIVANDLNNISIDNNIILNNKSYEIDKEGKSLEIGEIFANEIIIIKFNLKSKEVNEIKLSAKITGFYQFNEGDEKREKNYYSNTNSIKVNKVSLSNFFSADKEIVYKGDKVKYSTVLINDGTVNINFSYKINNSKSLILDEDGLIINGVVQGTEYYEGVIEPSSGIIIDQSYFYNNSFSNNKVFAEGLINYNYSINGKERISNIMKTDRIFIDAASTTFKEIIIEHKEKLIEFEEELTSVSKVYVTPIILNKYIIDKFRSIKTNKDIISSTKVMVKGMIALKIEYVSKSNNVYIHSKNLEFVTFIVLPNEYKEGEKIEVEISLEDIYYKIIDLSYLFLNINLIMKALF